MQFYIENKTGVGINIGGVIYGNGTYVPITTLIGFGGVKYTRNDVDGTNAGRGLNGTMIRDRVAIKGKWEITLTGAVKSVDAQNLLKLVEPESFNIRTDMPSGTLTTYNCYTNNIPVQFCMLKPDGTEYYSGMSLPIVEM